MPNITDPQAIKFCNEIIRPISEQLRALRANIDAATFSWNGGISAMIPNTADPIIDNREGDGVSRLTGADVRALVTALGSVKAAGADAVISKPCVRPLNAQ
jgi:hypothetical protein